MSNASFAQAKKVPPIRSKTDTSELRKLQVPTKLNGLDSVPLNFSSLDTLPPMGNAIDFSSVKVSDSGLDAEINFGGDSTWYDAINKKYHLYGIPGQPAHVDYEDLILTAGYIIFDIENDIAQAFSRQFGGQKIEPPTFIKGENTFTYSELKFNFKTKKGIVTDAITSEGEYFLHGAKTKFISKESDSLLLDDEIYNTDALITTCDLEHPHWGIRTRKLKLVPNKLAVIGFSQLEIAGIPMPIFLPFGFFPLVEGQSSGLILPNDYEFDKDFGLGFKEIGYYFPINDYVDLKLTGDIYTRGTFRIRANSNYRKRYAFSGSMNLGFSSNRIENASTGDPIRNTSINISLSHRQDSKAHPFRTIGGTVNIQTDNYQRNNFNDANSQLNNRLSSNFNFTHSMPGTPFSFRMGLSHNQNNSTRAVNITLPDISLNMNTIFPFKRKNATGGKKFYEQISLKYDLAMKNLVRTTDTTLFSQETLDNLQTGLSHEFSTNASFNVAKYFSFTPRATYDELWYFSSNQIDFNASNTVEIQDTLVDPEGNLIIRADTTYGSQIESIERGFQPVRLFNAGFGLTTQIFGTARFSKGLIRGIRHVIKPTVSFNFSPDSRSRYLETVDSDTRVDFNNPRQYNPYQNGALRSPSLNQRQMAVNFSVTNNFEAKYYSKKDSTEKNIKLLKNFTFRGGYNFAADSLNWQNISFSGNTKIMGLTSVVISGRYSPYVYENGRQTAVTQWSANKKLLDFRSFQARFNTDFTFSQIRDIFRGKKEEEPNSNNRSGNNRDGGNRGGRLGNEQSESENKLKNEGGSPFAQKTDEEVKEESILDLFKEFRISHQLVYDVSKSTDGSKKHQIMVNSLTLRGNIPLTEKWRLTLSNITYDFKRKSLVYPTFGISRDLHCWNMNFNWYPNNGVYSFFIGVKSNSLNFIKYNYGQNNASNFLRGR